MLLGFRVSGLGFGFRVYLGLRVSGLCMYICALNICNRCICVYAYIHIDMCISLQTLIAHTDQRRRALRDSARLLNI